MAFWKRLLGVQRERVHQSAQEIQTDRPAQLPEATEAAVETLRAIGGERGSKRTAALKLYQLAKSGGVRDSRIQYCGCGFPVRVVYRDGSEGPILGVLTSEQDPFDEYTHRYFCPECGDFVSKITQ